MSAPPTGWRGDARRLGRMLVGPPPSKPPGRVHMALDLSVFVAWCSLTALSWGAMPPLLTLAMFVLLLGAVLRTLGNLVLYHRWGGGRPGELLRLASGLLSGGFLGLLIAHVVQMGLQTGQWGWFWWTGCVLALSTVVAVAGHYYGHGEGPHPEDGPSAGRNPSD
ncbi:MAG TPA: hypothetical protein VE568_02400 [Rubrobacter sp.]|nr:hypothetical protein [Rubrobacter sp.]